MGPRGYGTSGPKGANDRATQALKELEPALKAFAAAHGGRKPDHPNQLEPYLTTPAARAAFDALKQIESRKQVELRR